MSGGMWAEKYRPCDFSGIVGQAEIIPKLEAFVKQKNMPHLLFAGPPGVGKTTAALVIAKQLFGESWRNNVLVLNASDERGIDVVRNKVKDFARTKALSNVPFKLCMLDECDSLTKEAQQALRRTMENYSSTCRFILLANYSSKIIDPIQSRCAVFRFKLLPKEGIFSIVDRIVKSENLNADEKAKEALYEVSEGDCRRLENILQSAAAVSDKITADTIFSVASVAKPKEIKEMMSLALQNKFIQAREKLVETMLDYGLSGLDVIKQMQKEAFELEVEPRLKMLLIEKCADIEFRMVEGADEFVQLEALLSVIATLKQ